MPNQCRLLILLCLVSGNLRGQVLDATSENQEAFFRRQVLPIFEAHCYPCHAHNSGQIEGGLALDWRSGWELGGTRGPAVVPGRPEQSLLIRAIEHTDPELQMPAEPLPREHIALLKEWVQRGAWDDRQTAPQPTEDPLDWWSLRPLVSPKIPSAPASHPIDAFIQARLDENRLTHSPPASPRALIRRLYYDLLGFPPSPEDVARFVADPSDAAYERLVDRLLASERYGERWARHWLDTIHFAESHGYEHDIGRDHAWPYRDYVIGALNDDVPWATFVRQQLAVDWFWPESTELLPALGFLAAGTFDLSTYSTGPVTFDYLDRDDMVHQTMSAFVSSTVNCARCHNHKFDPVAQEDYYALQAVFAGILKGDIPYDTDSLAARTRSQLENELRAIKDLDRQMLFSADAQQRVATWLDNHHSATPWSPLRLQSFASTDGSILTHTEEDRIVVSGPNPETDTYILAGKISIPRLSALRLELFPDPSLPMQGPGRCHNGNLHLSEIKVLLFAPQAQTAQELRLVHASADFNQEGWGVERAMDGDPKTAWGIFPEVGKPHTAIFELHESTIIPDGSTITIQLQQLHGGSHLIGSFRLSMIDAPSAAIRPMPAYIEAALQQPAENRSDQQKLQIAAHVLTQDVEQRLAALPARRSVYAAGPLVQIPAGNGNFQEARRATPKPVHLLQRGEMSKPLHEVFPGTFAISPNLPSRFVLDATEDAQDASATESWRRAALAQWIAHPDNPLTWRSIVNRVWHYHFGRGLCATPNDFGRMGDSPSHPELMDWLAIWFRDTAGGSLKRLHRLIVTSRTYRQSSEVRGDAASLDNENRLLWRQHRRRLDAESYRDSVLVVSGQIDWMMGGASNPNFQQSPGAQLTPSLDYHSYDWSLPGARRRSIYRYVWRGIPDPLMAALDFPDLGLLAPVRGESSSPLQSLSLYNHPFVLFHSQAMATNLAAEHPTVSDQITAAIERLYQRSPKSEELTRFEEFAQRMEIAAFCRVLLNSTEFLFIE